MSWTKDATSDAPRVIYTPGAGDAHPAVLRVVHDPEAVAGEEFTIVASGITAAGQTQAQFEESVGLT